MCLGANHELSVPNAGGNLSNTSTLMIDEKQLVEIKIKLYSMSLGSDLTIVMKFKI